MNQEVWSLLSLKKFFQTKETFFVVAYLNIQYENHSYFDENFVLYLLMGDCNVNLLNTEKNSKFYDALSSHFFAPCIFQPANKAKKV